MDGVAGRKAAESLQEAEVLSVAPVASGFRELRGGEQLILPGGARLEQVSEDILSALS